MSYPGLGFDAARKIDELRRAGGDEVDVERVAEWKEGADFDETVAIDCMNQCDDLLASVEGMGYSHSGFDARCAPLLHGALNLSERIAGDADFWRWLTFAGGYHGAELVDWRYGKRNPDGELTPARAVYYGLGLMKKGMFAKLWICANMMYVGSEAEPYDGIEYEDIDLWDSHVVDVDYGSSPAMARAFVKMVRDRKLPRGGSNASMGFRDLAKEIRRRHATIAVELFDEREARAWVEDLWSERESWFHKR